MEGKQLPEGRRVAPSILAADWSRMWEQVKTVMDAGAELIHVDVMDGHFVPPITMGPQMVQALSDHVHGAGGWLDVHLMIERPEHQVEAFAKAGADSISIHWEATPHVHYALKAVHEAGCLAGLAINPATPPEAVVAAADTFDILLCMTVDPGWGGQAFIDSSKDKVRRLRSILPDRMADRGGRRDRRRHRAALPRGRRAAVRCGLRRVRRGGPGRRLRRRCGRRGRFLTLPPAPEPATAAAGALLPAEVRAPRTPWRTTHHTSSTIRCRPEKPRPPVCGLKHSSKPCAMWLSGKMWASFWSQSG